MEIYVEVAGLRVAESLHRFIIGEAIPGSGVEAETFFSGLASLVDRFGSRNEALLRKRSVLQGAIDDWHRTHPWEPEAYRAYLEEIGYLVPEGPPFSIDTHGVDPEISMLAGPQLVVPASNPRYVLNAANARWGSLYDALYGTDALGQAPANAAFDSERARQVISWVRVFLDETVPLECASHADVEHYTVQDGVLVASVGGRDVGLADPDGFVGHVGDSSAPSSIVLRHHGLHLDLQIDRSHPVGATDCAGIADVLLESALTTIVDLEDSIAAVDADDKVVAYRTWLGLMTGTLEAEVEKDGRTFNRLLHPDRLLTAPDGTARTLRSRSLLLVRNVGLLMVTDAVLDREGREIPEGLLDALVTVLCATHDLRRQGLQGNSRSGAVYVVKPKLHGPEEAALTNEVFEMVEDLVGLPRGTVKVGLMDEERRTTLNLLECVRVLSARIFFINTGFLDRTGDEIHTSMEAGAVVRKGDMRTAGWLGAYEDRNVEIGLRCGLVGRAQIGKGMWAAPERMAELLREKIAQPIAGASCAWVPSPTAATLHATHYHRVDVAARQRALLGRSTPRRRLFEPPIAADGSWTPDEITAEVENNAQGILGYVVRWVDQGVGCSKVADRSGLALMEDRATCRISAQHLANWIRHGVITDQEVKAAFRRMAALVDAQNAGDPAYVAMGPTFDGLAFAAAINLALEGASQPSGYTEPILHGARRARKQQLIADARDR